MAATRDHDDSTVTFSGGSINLANVPVKAPKGMTEDRVRELLKASAMGKGELIAIDKATNANAT